MPARGTLCSRSSPRGHMIRAVKEVGPHMPLYLCLPPPNPGCEWLWSYLADSCENGGVGHHLEGKKKDKVQTTGMCNREEQTLTLKVAAAIWKSQPLQEAFHKPQRQAVTPGIVPIPASVKLTVTDSTRINALRRSFGGFKGAMFHALLPLTVHHTAQGLIAGGQKNGNT